LKRRLQQLIPTKAVTNICKLVDAKSHVLEALVGTKSVKNFKEGENSTERKIEKTKL